MGAGGEDVIMAKAARQLFPWSLECKNVEKLNVWTAYEQASRNSPAKYEPIVVMKKNNKKPLVVVDAETFIKLHKKGDDHEKHITETE